MKIAASIVTYNPLVEKLKQNIEAIINQVDMVIIVDNGSLCCKAIKTLINDIDGSKIYLKELGSNKGIASALNVAAGCAYDGGFDWLITLDQDSVAPLNLTEVYLKFSEMENAAVLAPLIQYDNGVIENNFHNEDGIQKVEKCITSASMIKLSVWKSVGGFDDKMFIDYVDFDYCLTVREHGYCIYCCEAAVLQHELGKSETKKLFLVAGPSKIKVYNHSPLRTYYYTRNALYYIRKHSDKGLLCKNQEYKILIRWLMIKLIYEQNRAKCFKAILRGIKDSKKLEADK